MKRAPPAAAEFTEVLGVSPSDSAGWYPVFLQIVDNTPLHAQVRRRADRRRPPRRTWFPRAAPWPACAHVRFAFDLLELQGRELRDQPLVQRRARLQALLRRTKCDLLRFSDSFPDASVLLAECSRRRLEGIVAKRKDASYRSGTRSGWVKVKTAEWKATNRWRGEFFEKA